MIHDCVGKYDEMIIMDWYCMLVNDEGLYYVNLLVEFVAMPVPILSSLKGNNY